MTLEEIHARLHGALGDRIAPLAPAKKDAFAVVQPGALVEACTLLKTEPALAMDCLQSVAGVDYPKRSQIDVVYHLWSYARRHAFVLKVQLDRAAPRVASLVPLWSSANWLERETYDLLGVTFEGHPDLRRILLPDDWVGHPLRRDYEEQPSWHGISTTRESPLDGFVRLDELKKKVAAAAAASKAAAVAKREDTP